MREVSSSWGVGCLRHRSHTRNCAENAGTSTDRSLREQQASREPLPHLVRVESSMAGGIRNSDAMAFEASARPRFWRSTAVTGKVARYRSRLLM